MAKSKRKCNCEHCDCEDDSKNIKVYFCPKCKSKDVGFMFRFKNIFGVIPRMRCRKCGFESMTFPLLVISKDKLNKKENKK